KPYTVQTLRDAFKELLIRKFAWLDGPSRRILSLQKLTDALPKHQGDFEVQALEMRSALTDLHRNLPMMKLEDCIEKAQGIAYFAHRYGFVALEHTMQSLINAAKQGQVTSCEPLLRKQKEEFEQAYEAVRSWRSQTSLPAPQMMIA
ncbi:MAG: hypothetical protein RL693_1276, partial [Verrucomicrobiota bacterium]